MHLRGFALFLLGAWIAGSLFMTMVATQNFRSVDRLLDGISPKAALILKPVPRDQVRQLLRYQVSEQNRWYFGTWDVVQVFLGLGLFLFLLLASHERPFVLGLALGMVLIAFGQAVFVTPEVTSIGRTLDFVDGNTPERAKFWVMHGAYSGLEVLKWLTGVILGVRLLIRRR
jgi:hypothetical protein